jgi:enterochelin esterase-like enzyme
MRRYELALLTLLATLFFSACQPVLLTPVPPVGSPDEQASTGSMAKATAVPEPTERPVFNEFEYLPGVMFQATRFTSQALADNLIGDPAERDVWIQLPPDYDTSDKHYPVVYVLHGFLGGEASLVRDVGLALKQLLDAGEAEEMILVYLNANNRFGGSQYRSSPTIGDYETYITQELMELIDANFRTLPHRDSRGLLGCSMGGDGAIHLAFTYPEVYGVAVAVSSTPDYERDPSRERSKKYILKSPASLSEASSLPWQARHYVALAAVAASNPDLPPLYLDMPFEFGEDGTQIVPEVFDQINALDMVHEVQDYLDQPTRLNGVLFYHGEQDLLPPIEMVQNFSQMLTELGVEHEVLTVRGGHCDLDYKPALQFLSEHLLFEE